MDDDDDIFAINLTGEVVIAQSGDTRFMSQDDLDAAIYTAPVYEDDVE